VVNKTVINNLKIKNMEENLVEEAIEALVESEKSNNPDDYCDNEYAEYKIIVNKLNEFIEENEADFASFNSEKVNEVLVDYDNDGIFDFIEEKYNEELYDSIYNSSVYCDLFMDKIQYIKDEKIDEAIDEFDDLEIKERLYFFLKLKELSIKPTKELYEKYFDCGEDKTAFFREISIDYLLTS